MLNSDPFPRCPEELEGVVYPSLVERYGGAFAEGLSEFVANGVPGRHRVLDSDEARSKQVTVGVENGQAGGKGRATGWHGWGRGDLW